MTEGSLAPPDEVHVVTKCLPSTGGDCRYLTKTMGGWSCEKLSHLKGLIDARVERGLTRARGDNCDGKGSR